MMSQEIKRKALLIRLDRIGDLVLTLPADQQTALRDYDCFWYISKGLGFVPENANPRRRFFEGSKNFSVSQTWHFFKIIRDINPEISVSFHAPWWVNLCLVLAGVKIRAGVLSQWHSYLFLNRGIRQKRSLCEHHELEYNHLLVHEALGEKNPPEYPHLQLEVPLAKPFSALPPKYVVVHPGMAGSAMNWPIKHYAELIRKLSKDTVVVITGTANDQFILEPLKEKFPIADNLLWLDGHLNAIQLLQVLKNAAAVFAPSTGVIHLAASLGTPTYGIYSPINVESAKRWGPRGKFVKTFTPAVDPTSDNLGLDSMALVSPQEIYDSILMSVK